MPPCGAANDTQMISYLVDLFGWLVLNERRRKRRIRKRIKSKSKRTIQEFNGLGILLLIFLMLVFLFIREPAIDNMSRRPPPERGLRATIWEAITAHSHHPDYPAEIAVEAEKEA